MSAARRSSDDQRKKRRAITSRPGPDGCISGTSLSRGDGDVGGRNLYAPIFARRQRGINRRSVSLIGALRRQTRAVRDRPEVVAYCRTKFSLEKGSRRGRRHLSSLSGVTVLGKNSADL